eukprot:2991645-Rhodomonas_salina.1
MPAGARPTGVPNKVRENSQTQKPRANRHGTLGARERSRLTGIARDGKDLEVNPGKVGIADRERLGLAEVWIAHLGRSPGLLQSLRNKTTVSERRARMQQQPGKKHVRGDMVMDRDLSGLNRLKTAEVPIGGARTVGRCAVDHHSIHQGEV